MVILLYQRLGAFLMSMHQFIKFICLDFQAVPPVLQVGKLSNNIIYGNIFLTSGIFFTITDMSIHMPKIINGNPTLYKIEY